MNFQVAAKITGQLPDGGGVKRPGDSGGKFSFHFFIELTYLKRKKSQKKKNTHYLELMMILI